MFKRTNFIFCRFSDVNDNKMVFITLKCFLCVKIHIYRMINVIIIKQKLHFKNNTGKNRIQLSEKME